MVGEPVEDVRLETLFPWTTPVVVVVVWDIVTIDDVGLESHKVLPEADTSGDIFVVLAFVELLVLGFCRIPSDLLYDGGLSLLLRPAVTAVHEDGAKSEHCDCGPSHRVALFSYFMA